eukprot:169813_1
MQTSSGYTTSDKYKNRPSSLRYWDAAEIIDGLLLGSVTAIKRTEAFEYFNINAVLSILTESQMNLHDDLEQHLNEYSISKINGNWLRFEFTDARLNNDIQKHLHNAADFINKFMIQNETTNNEKQYVMVHCWAGASRSPTMIAAYLIKYKNFTCTDALNLLAEKRNVAYPKAYFLEQLTQFESNLNSSCCCVIL